MSRSRTTCWLLATALGFSALLSSGCAYLRVPRIDPTGESIFIEPPIAAAPADRAEPGPPLSDTDVAVVLTPATIVAPVGSQVVLTGGVRGADGLLRTNRRLEWSLSGTGHFVDVGRNTFVDWLVGDFNRPRKVDNTYAIGSTSRQDVLLDRGTPTPEDDICLPRGKGWVSLSSPVEGTSRVTVYAPEVNAWDCRSRTAMVHWIDAQFAFPAPSINPAGSRHVLTTTVTRQSDQSPCEAWVVRYEIVDGPPAGFTPNGTTAVEVPTNADGQASAEIFQAEPTPGTNRIAIQVIRPATVAGAAGRRLVVGNGSTLKTWTAADLAIQKTGPASAGVGAEIAYRIEVTNPGDLAANEVVLTDNLPVQLDYLSSTPPAELGGRQLRWRLGQLAPGQTQTVDVRCRTTAPGSVTNQAEVSGQGGLRANAQATTSVAAAEVDVRTSGPRQVAVGGQATFQIVVTNRRQVPTGPLLIKDRFAAGLRHAAAESPIERDLGSLAPGETQQLEVTFEAVEPGRWCHTVEVLAEGQLLSSAEACVTAVAATAEPPIAQPEQQSPPALGFPPRKEPELQPEPAMPETPTSVSVQKMGPDRAVVGGIAEFTIDVTNTGDEEAQGLTIVDRYDAALSPVKATAEHRAEGTSLIWRVPSLPAGKTARFQVHCDALRVARQACNRVTVTGPNGFAVEDEACLEIVEAGEQVTMEVGDSRDPVRLSKGLTYEIRVANPGDTPDTQVVLSARLPEGMLPDRIGTSGPTTPAIDGRTVRFAPVAALPPGEQVLYRVRVLTQQPGTFTFRAELSSDNLPQPVIAEETTEVFE